MTISMNDPNGTFYTTKDDFVVSVDYGTTIAVGTGDYKTQVELDEHGAVISFMFMCDNVVLLDLDADEYIKFSKIDQLIAGERLRLTVNKIKKAKETKNDNQ